MRHTVKEVDPGIGVECAIDLMCVLMRRDSRLSHQHNAALGPSSADFSGQGLLPVVGPRGARSPAIAGDAFSSIAPGW